MRIFAPRKTRSAKAASLSASTKWTGKIAEHLSNLDVLLRLAICLVFLTLLVGVLGSWRSPMRYRLGDYVPDGILARIDFERVNVRKTELARLDRERQVPLVYRNDPTVLRNLDSELREDLRQLAVVHRPQELVDDVEIAFGLMSDATPEGKLAEVTQSSWNALRQAIGPAESKERTIEEIVGEFTIFIAPLRETGLLEPQELIRRDLTTDRPMTVVLQDVTIEVEKLPPSVTVADVLVDEILKPGGRLGRQWSQFPLLAPLQPSLEHWLRHRSRPSLTYDEALTNTRLRLIRQATPTETDKFQRGQVIVAPGSWIDEESLDILRVQYDAIEQRVPWAERVTRVAIVTLLLLVLGGVIAFYLVRNEPRLARHAGRLTVYLTAVTLAVGLGRLLALQGWRAEVVPLLATVMILAIAYNQIFAALTGFSLALLQTLSTGGTVGEFVVLMSAVAAAVVPLHTISSRSKIVIVGCGTALVYILVSWGMHVVRSQELSRLWTDWYVLSESLSGAVACFVTGLLVSGMLPFIEQIFGVVTDLSLLELGDVSHPLLQELVRRAPGTYNHSIGVATIAETAADAIGANGLLCRVGAYFHDIGKMLKPQYFVENMLPGQASRHQQLNPAMSTLIIIGHVKDGADLARQYNLPDPLIDFVEQHHGTTLVEYFFHAATKQAEAQPEEFRTVVEESSFRYPGPKPQSKEAAVMMLADAVEGASRALSEPTPKRLETLVHELAIKRLLDGQFDESTLTLTELSIIEDSLTKSLIGIYHGRIKYPEQQRSA